MERIPRPLTTLEVAERFGVDRRTVLNWVFSGRLKPVFRAGDTSRAGYMFDEADVEALLAEVKP